MKSLRLRCPLHLAMLAVAIMCLSGCGSSTGQQVEKKHSAAEISGAGSTFAARIFKAWIEEYSTSHADADITYDAVGSGDGIKRFIGQGIEAGAAVDFGASDAALNDEELSRVPNTLMLPVTGGMVVLVYNLPDINGTLKLSREAYTGIFSGEVTKWDDPLIAKTNPEVKLPNFDIIPVVRSDSSGTTFAFTNHLSAISPRWREKFGAKKVVAWSNKAGLKKGNEGVAAWVNTTVGSIGYIEFAYASKSTLKVATLENHDGQFVTPSHDSSAQTLSSATLPADMRLFVPDPVGDKAYPIVSLTWVLLRPGREASKTSSMKSFFRWCLTEGQARSESLGYVELPENIRGAALKALDELK